jgi:hydrogenase maturation protease
MKRCIICIGNRFVADDAAGPAVYDRLMQMQPLPGHIEVIDGGIMGLNLLPLLERGGRVIFVDAVSGFGTPGEIVLLSRQEILHADNAFQFDHNAGLAYLLAVLPRVCDGEMPEEIALVGVEGTCSPQLADRAAVLSLDVAIHGLSRFSHGTCRLKDAG